MSVCSSTANIAHESYELLLWYFNEACLTFFELDNLSVNVNVHFIEKSGQDIHLKCAFCAPH